MKHLSNFTEWNKNESKSSFDTAVEKLTAKDKEHYEEFLKMNAKEIAECRKIYKDLFKKALKNINDVEHAKGGGSAMMIDTTDTDIIKYGKLSKDDLNAFIRCARILEFKDGFKPAEKKK